MNRLLARRLAPRAARCLSGGVAGVRRRQQVVEDDIKEEHVVEFDVHTGAARRFRVRNVAELSRIASALATEAIPGDAFCVYGDLGVGKTEFVRQFLRARTRQPDLLVPSPTFTLDISYEHGDTVLHHVDLYRMTKPIQAEILDIPDALYNDIVLVEWPERLAYLYPRFSLDVRLSEVDLQDRLVELVPRTRTDRVHKTVRADDPHKRERRNRWLHVLDECIERAGPALLKFQVSSKDVTSE